MENTGFKSAVDLLTGLHLYKWFSTGSFISEWIFFFFIRAVTSSGLLKDYIILYYTFILFYFNYLYYYYFCSSGSFIASPLSPSPPPSLPPTRPGINKVFQILEMLQYLFLHWECTGVYCYPWWSTAAADVPPIHLIGLSIWGRPPAPSPAPVWLPPSPVSLRRRHRDIMIRFCVAGVGDNVGVNTDPTEVSESRRPFCGSTSPTPGHIWYYTLTLLRTNL